MKLVAAALSSNKNTTHDLEFMKQVDRTIDDAEKGQIIKYLDNF